MYPQNPKNSASGFSLIELLIAMAVALTIMAIASTLLSSLLNVRAREDSRGDAISDVQRGLNIMTREIANSGLALPADAAYTPPGGTATAVPRNGLLTEYSDNDSVAIVANLDAYTDPLNGGMNLTQEHEAIRYSLYLDTAQNRRFLVRQDLNTSNVQVLANRIDDVRFRYINRNPANGNVVTNAVPSANTIGITISVTVTLDAVGTPRSPGYQPPFQTQINSEVVMRNAIRQRY